MDLFPICTTTLPHTRPVHGAALCAAAVVACLLRPALWRTVTLRSSAALQGWTLRLGRAGRTGYERDAAYALKDGDDYGLGRRAKRHAARVLHGYLHAAYARVRGVLQLAKAA